MKTLFLIDGAAGTVKTDMLEYLRLKYTGRGQVAVLSKYTTREHRKEERERNLPLDLEFVSRRKFDELSKAPGFYSYTYGGASYGFRSEDVNKLLEANQHVFVVVRDRAMIEQLIDDYPRICAVPVFIYSDRNETENRLLQDGYTKEAIKFRLERQQLAWDDYLKHSGLYREIIINNSNKTDFHRLIDYLVQKYAPENEPRDVLAISHFETFQLLRPLIGFKKAIRERLENYDRNVFLMMKFRDSNKLVYEFIRKQLKGIGFNCVRADQPEWNITHNIYNPLAVIYCCRYGIALFDEPEEGNFFSPNVAYELSMMHMQGKECLILRNRMLPAMPFDLIKDVHEAYSKDLELEKIVRTWISKLR